MERKNNKSDTPRSVGKKVQDSKTQKSLENETSSSIKNTSKVFEIGPKFSETHVFQGTILHPCNWQESQGKQMAKVER